MRTLVHRSAPGAIGCIGIAAAYGAAIADPESLRAATVTAIALALLGMARLAFHATSVRLMRDRPARWRWIFGGLAVAPILVWDGFASLEILHRRIDAMSLVLVVTSFGLHATAACALAPDLLLLRLDATVSRLPMLAALPLIGGPAAQVLGLVIALEGCYELARSRRLHAEFWQARAVRDRLDGGPSPGRDEIDLRLAQKLEAVGRLATGIAHEINTPLQSVAGNIHYATDSVRDLLRLVEAYRAELARSALAVDAQHRLAAAEHTADLPYVIENLPQALAMALDGLGRTATIVRSIREFARSDDANMTAIDLNRALETTLALARHEYGAIAELELDLGDLPPVRCHGGELNQVFLNLIINAAHAIETKLRLVGGKGRITVRTRCVADHAEVAVADTGVGIAADIRDRVFDPFFTTRDIGKGSGQGLAVAHAVVVKRHGGEIRFESEVGRGTTFFVRIPIDGKPGALRERVAACAS